MAYLKIHYKLLLLLILTFILMTVIGTLTHELGHYAVSKFLGYEARINYGSSTRWDNEFTEYYNNLWEKYPNELKNNLDFPGKDDFQRRMDKYQQDGFWITLGGPLQTMFTGTFGLLLLWFNRHKVIKADKVTLVGWTYVFISLFWLRQVANLLHALMVFMLKGKVSARGDEMRLALYLDWNTWSIQIITGLCGLAVLFIVLRLLPKTLILTFLVSGLTGGILGYYLWLIKFGKYIMP